MQLSITLQKFKEMNETDNSEMYGTGMYLYIMYINNCSKLRVEE